jgi:hypothetical protein
LANDINDKAPALVVAGGRQIDRLEDVRIDELRASLDDPVIRKQLENWLRHLAAPERKRELDVLSEVGDALRRTASDSETRADFFGNLANPGGVIAAAMLGATIIGTATLTWPVGLCILAGASLYGGGHAYKFKTSRAAKRDKERSDQCDRIAGRHMPREE